MDIKGSASSPVAAREPQVRHSTQGCLADRNFPHGNSVIADAIRARDWSATDLGPIDHWPDELCFALNMILDSKFPYFLVWGEEMLSFFNDAYAHYVEDKPFALGAPFSQVWKETWPTLGPIVRAAYAGSASYFEDLPIRSTRPGVEGSIAWWTFGFSPLRDRDGVVGGALCTATETTRRVLIEKDLERSETALRQFNDLVPQMLWEADAAGTIIYRNRQLATFTGKGTSEQLDWTANVHPDDISAIIAVYAEAQTKGRSFECQHRLRRADGEYRWVLARAAPVLDDHGNPTGWYGCATDIHDWRLTVDQLRKSEDMVRRFAENAARILWITDLDTGRIEFLNAAGRRFWKGERSDAISDWKGWFTILPEDQHTLASDAVERVRAGETFTGPFRVVDGDGVMFTMNTTLFPILENDGRIAKFGGIADMIDGQRRHLIHLVDPDRDAHRRMSADLWAKGYEVRGFTDVHAFAKAAPSLLPGCVVIRGTAHTAWIGRAVAAARQQRDRLQPVVLTERHRDVDHVLELMKLGACDVLAQDASWAVLGPAIDKALADLDDSLTGPVDADGAPNLERLSQLSSREREILKQLVAGATNKVVAIELGISPRTVEAHRARIMEKLGVSTLAEAIAIVVSSQHR